MDTPHTMPAWKKWAIGAGILLALGLVGGAMQAAGITPNPDDHGAQAQATPGHDDTTPAPQTEGAPSSGAPTEGEAAYLEALYRDARAEGSGIHGHGDKKVLKLGYAVCEDIDNGMTPTAVVQSLKDADRAVSTVAHHIVGHAQTYLCQ